MVLLDNGNGKCVEKSSLLNTYDKGNDQVSAMSLFSIENDIIFFINIFDKIDVFAIQNRRASLFDYTILCY